MNVREIFALILERVPSEPAANGMHSVLAEMPNLFCAYELNPVAPKAQKKVPIPEGLDLDQWINDPLPELTDDSDLDDRSPSTPSVEYDSSEKSTKRRKKGRKVEVDSSDDEDEKIRVSDTNPECGGLENREGELLTQFRVLSGGMLGWKLVKAIHSISCLIRKPSHQPIDWIMIWMMLILYRL